MAKKKGKRTPSQGLGPPVDLSSLAGRDWVNLANEENCEVCSSMAATGISSPDS